MDNANNNNDGNNHHGCSGNPDLHVRRLGDKMDEPKVVWSAVLCFIGICLAMSAGIGIFWILYYWVIR